MLQVDMSASTRDSFGKCAMRRLRSSGNTPAVLYGNNKESISLQLETKSFLKGLFQINRTNAVVSLSINGDDTRHVMMREVQTDPVTDDLIHADFFEISLDVPKKFNVNIELIGNAKGVDLGGELAVHHSSVVVEGLPLDMPDSIVVDIADLEIGDSVKFSDLDLPANLKMFSDLSDTCIEVRTKSAEIIEDEDSANVSEPVADEASEE
ncbi:MAG: 50S ribosomal protein L25 [Desulfocapsa sp.]|nr:50S ribosomal protein L25 [Desulfocapsa sp.]